MIAFSLLAFLCYSEVKEGEIWIIITDYFNFDAPVEIISVYDAIDIYMSQNPDSDIETLELEFDGARSNATILSIVETAKANGLHPRKYLEYLLTHLPNRKNTPLEAYLPWAPKVQVECNI